MKQVIAAALFAASLAANAQPLATQPAQADSVNLRLEMASIHMRKAAWNRNTSVVIALVGGLFTIISSDRSYPGYRQSDAVAVGSITAAGFCFTQWMGARHDHKASMRLAGHFE